MKIRQLPRVYLICILCMQVGRISVVTYSQTESEFTVYDILTCNDYNETDHYPILVTDYYDVTDSGVFIWVNTSFIPRTNLTTVWRYPNSTIYSKESREIPVFNYFETIWRDEAFYLEIAEEKPSQIKGEWTVELYHNDVFATDYSFNIIDRSGPDWKYSASILSIESPETVTQNQNFTVSLEVYYNFVDMTILTPGLWDPETSNLFNEANDTVTGEGIKTYNIEMAVFDVSGPYTIDATAFYLIDDEWFLDDEGIMSFDIVIEIQQGTSTLIYIGGLVLVIVLAFFILRNRIQSI